MRLVKFTAANGDLVYVNPETVQRVRTPLDNEFITNAKTVIIDYHGPFAVQEPLREVVARLAP